ncbi:hypothetical protein PRIEUP_LOCUS1825, partial [Pristimantis euphronides]
MSQITSQDWIIGAFAVLVMVFFIGCTSCWQYKPSDPAGRRQPPPPPSPDGDPRYQHSFFHMTPSPELAAQHSGPRRPSTENEEESEEDFEEGEFCSPAPACRCSRSNSAFLRKRSQRGFRFCQSSVYINPIKGPVQLYA